MRGVEPIGGSQGIWRALVTAVLAATLIAGEAACQRIGREHAQSATATPVGVVRYVPERNLPNLLLPLGAVPPSLAPGGNYLLPNEVVARFFPDPDAALRAMSRYGRVQGAGVDYSLRASPRAGEQALHVTSTVALYSSAAGAEAVLQDPTLELVLHRFGLTASEIKVDRFAHGTRAFRGYRDGDDPDTAAYLVLFRRDNLIGAVVVVVPAATDDGGRLAVSLARRQAALPLPFGAGQ
jgi:hypothetical protein